MNNSEATRQGTVAGISAVILWASAASWISAAVGVHPFLYYGTEALIGFLIMAAKWRCLSIKPWTQLKAAPAWYYAIGVVGIGLQGAAWVAAIQSAPPLEALLFIYQWPMMVVIFTALAMRQRLGLHHAIAICLGLAGMATILIGRGMDLNEFHFLPGHMWGLVAALTWSIFSAVSARRKDIGPEVIGGILLLSGVINIGIWLVIGAPMPPLTSWLITLVASLFIMPGYILWDYGMKRGNTRLIGICSFMIPVFSSALLIALNQAKPTLLLLPAFILVMSGIAVARYGEALFRRSAPAQSQ